jgi:Phosphodiester glycosidase
MSNGIVAIPPRSGLATVAMYKNGTIKIGEWGKDLTESDQMVAWRQNCSLIIQNGMINPLVNIDSAEYWGANLNGATVTWRSGIGISPDNNILYFFAGPSMTANVLAQTMMSVGVKAGMQLDINNYWVHFIAVRTDGTKLIPDPLFPEDMKFDADRFLKPYTRDFFYVALKSP